MSRRYSHVIFDFDGVILLSMDAWERALTSVLGQRGFTCSREILEESEGLTVRERLAVCFRERGDVTAETMEKLTQEIYVVARETIRDHPTLVPGVAGCARSLHVSHVPLGVVSSTGKSFIERVLQQFELESVFDMIVGYEDVTRHKPDPEAYNIALQRFGVSGERVLVFEDSLYGVDAARAAGCNVIGVATTKTERELRDHGALGVISDFTDFRLRDFLTLS